MQIFVYGTLKPGEANYKQYCADLVIGAQRAVVQGNLFALRMGYPAMTTGEGQVQGYLLSFADDDILIPLDNLEDYQPHRSLAENLYYRQYIQVYNLQGLLLGWAWVYLMTTSKVDASGGVLLLDGWWSGCGLTAN